MHLRFLIVVLFLAITGCDQQPGSWSWSCRATHDIQCSDGDCEVAGDMGLVPIEASFDASGGVSMCAYSGCWSGDGQVQVTRQFHSIVGENLRWNAPDRQNSGVD